MRINLVCAGPLRTLAAKTIPDFENFETEWKSRAPLGWDITEPNPVASACVGGLLSGWFPGTIAEMLHVDGGYHAMGA